MGARGSCGLGLQPPLQPGEEKAVTCVCAQFGAVWWVSGAGAALEHSPSHISHIVVMSNTRPL